MGDYQLNSDYCSFFRGLHTCGKAEFVAGIPARSRRCNAFRMETGSQKKRHFATSLFPLMERPAERRLAGFAPYYTVISARRLAGVEMVIEEQHQARPAR